LTAHQVNDADLAEYYNSTHDVSEFEGGEVVESSAPPQPETRSVTISVRFSPSELAEVEKLAHAAGMRLTTFIRETALTAEDPPVNRAEVLDLISALRRSVERKAPAAPPSRSNRQ
jgi:hypothetical protein